MARKRGSLNIDNEREERQKSGGYLRSDSINKSPPSNNWLGSSKEFPDIKQNDVDYSYRLECNIKNLEDSN